MLPRQNKILSLLLWLKLNINTKAVRVFIIAILIFSTLGLLIVKILFFCLSDPLLPKRTIIKSIPLINDINTGLKRGDIVDRNNILLARNIVTYDFYFNPYRSINPYEELNKILSIFPNLEYKKQKLIDLINAKKTDPKGLILIKRNIFLVEKEKILDAGVIGVNFNENQRRIYPHNNVASHVLGFLSIEGEGMAGVERSFNQDLTTKFLNKPLQLSLDIHIQAIVRDIMRKYLKLYKASAATAIIMNSETGEIITAISLPDFNPNNVQKYSNNHIFNRFSFGVYELGSVFKIFLAALAVHNGIPLTKKYNAIDPMVIDNHIITNFRGTTPTLNKEMDLLDIIKRSSNVGSGRVILELTAAKQKDMLKSLGLLDKLELELPEKATPIYPKRWKNTQSVTISYGYGIAVSPMHFIAAASSIANDGQLVKPTLLKNPLSQPLEKTLQVIDKNSSMMVRRILREVVLSGTGKRGASEKYDVGGKSGTAMQLVNGAYSATNNLISFFAIVPAKKPKYSYYITIHNPMATEDKLIHITGGNMVAPIISELITLTGPMLNIPINY